MVPLALMHVAPQIQGSEVIFFIDNTSALHSLVKGSSRDWWVDRAVALVHLVAAMHDLYVHVEYVESEANWADSTSRLLDLDPFAMKHGFPLEEVRPDIELYQVSYTKLVQSLKNTLG